MAYVWHGERVLFRDFFSMYGAESWAHEHDQRMAKERPPRTWGQTKRSAALLVQRVIGYSRDPSLSEDRRAFWARGVAPVLALYREIDKQPKDAPCPHRTAFVSCPVDGCPNTTEIDAREFWERDGAHVLCDEHANATAQVIVEISPITDTEHTEIVIARLVANITPLFDRPWDDPALDWEWILGRMDRRIAEWKRDVATLERLHPDDYRERLRSAAQAAGVLEILERDHGIPELHQEPIEPKDQTPLNTPKQSTVDKNSQKAKAPATPKPRPNPKPTPTANRVQRPSVDDGWVF